MKRPTHPSYSPSMSRRCVTLHPILMSCLLQKQHCQVYKKKRLQEWEQRKDDTQMSKAGLRKRCRICRQVGHNKSNCPQAYQAQSQQPTQAPQAFAQSFQQPSQPSDATSQQHSQPSQPFNQPSQPFNLPIYFVLICNWVLVDQFF